MEKYGSESEKKTNNLTEQIGYFQYAFENVQNLAEFADSKANTLLTIHALIVTLASAVLLLEKPSPLFNSIIDIAILGIIFLILMISSLFSIIVVLPRDATSDKSLFYYRTIGNFENTDDYLKSFQQLDKAKITEALANQAYEVSKIVSRKMKYVRYSLYLMLAYLFSIMVGSVLMVLF